MGIQGLIPFLDKVSSRINISQYRGYCVAVDAYCWLHKGAYTCAEKLAKGEKCDAYVFYCMKYVNMLLSHNIKPILVFDGRYLPAKAGTEKKRRESRETNRKTATDLLNAGRVEEARNYLRRCVEITHTMALALIKECRKNNVDCIVAPYEADAQLAYLNLQNIAQIIITEDSDLILFGCSKIVFKMDLQGNGLLVERERLHLSMGLRAENFSFDNFRYMCILSGCDYLPSLPGIGLNKALKFMKKTRDPDIHRALRRIPSYLNMTQLRVSDEYRDAFVTADATFRYQPVFDPRTRRLVPLTNLPEGEDPPAIVDEQLPQKVAFNLALGNLDPFTLTRVDNFDPDCPQRGVASLPKRSWAPSSTSIHPSIWSQDFSGFQFTPTEKDLPSNLNCSSILDVTPLHLPKQTEGIVLDESPSQTDLMSMYRSEEPKLKKLCPSSRGVASPRKSPITQDNESTSIHLGEIQQQPPPSPILSHLKTRNPFAKPKQTQSCGLGPPGPTGRPNYFSALRKFDGIYPMDVNSDVVVVSRYFRSGEEVDQQQAPDPGKGSNILKDMSNKDLLSSEENAVLDEDSMLTGYIYEKENFKESSPQKVSVLAEIDAMQSKEVPFPTSLLNETSEADCREKDQIIEKVKISGNNDSKWKGVSCKSPAPSFNWSQFTCKKAVSCSKLTTSQAVNRTFKNPFKKKIVFKSSDPLESSSMDSGGEGDTSSYLTSSSKTKSAESDLEIQDSFIPKDNSPCANNLSDEDIFNTSVDEPELGLQASSIIDSSTPMASGSYGDDLTKREKPETTIMELGPSEDTLWLREQCLAESVESEEQQQKQLSGESVDSGYQGSQDMSSESHLMKPMKKENLFLSRLAANTRTTPGRRLGLARSSTPNPAPQKQNPLAQYGFSKKRKLAH